MRRNTILFPILIFALGCKKHPKEDPDPGPPPGPPKVGHSVTKVGAEGSDEATPTRPKPHPAGDDDSAPPPAVPMDARPVGGNGKPSFRDDEGHPHGPGGPVFMGKGVCDGAHDHCMRPGVWFSVANIVAGKMFRAVPVYELEGKWYTWRSDVETPVKVYRTELAGNAPIAAGTSVIFFSTETSSAKWPDSEYEALVSSRWEAGVTEAPSANGSVRIKGYGSTPIDSVRLIVETK